MHDQQLRELVSQFLDVWSVDLRTRTGSNNDYLEHFLGPLSKLDVDNVSVPEAVGSPHASLLHLDSAIDAIDVEGELGALAAKLARRVKWRGLYEGGGIPDSLANGMSAGRIAGPGALIESSDVLAGFFLLAPNVYYPKHDHEAIEIYQAVSGTTAVTHGVEGEPVVIEKGSCQYQSTYLVHDLQVGEQPALILYLWAGNLDAPTWWWRRDDAGVWWRDCWERQPDLTLRMTRSERAD